MPADGTAFVCRNPFLLRGSENLDSCFPFGPRSYSTWVYIFLIIYQTFVG